MTDTRISRALRGADGRLHPIIRALMYTALAFWLLSADEFLGPPLRRAATALHATGLSPARDAFYETINLIIGTMNGNVSPVNHLLSTSFQGPAWVTGGVLGTEASFFMYPTIALTFLYVSWRRFSNQPPP
jgi:hypothetical protein